MKIDAVIFDLAGTTITDNGTVMRAFEGALNNEKIDYDRDYLRESMGHSKTQVLGEVARRAGLEGEDAEEFVKRAHEKFQDLYIEMCRAGEVKPIPGAREAFEQLKEWGVRIATTTGFHERVAHEVNKILDPRGEVIDAAISSDMVPRGRPAPDMILTACVKMSIPEMKNVANVGDTRADLESGAHAEVGVNIGVFSGEAPRETLETAPHTHLVASVAEVPELIGKIMTGRKQ